MRSLVVSRRRWLLPAALAAALAPAAGCRDDMADQPRYEPLVASDFFPDGMASRPLVDGTIARGQLLEDRALETGKDADGQFLLELPVPLDDRLLRRGQERFNIFCSVCHGLTGEGNGMIVQRGFRQPPTYHSDRLRGMPVGYFYDVIAEGFGAMPSYRKQVPLADRWAIVAYVRALQLSRHAPAAELSEAERARLLPAPAAAAAPSTAPSSAAPSPAAPPAPAEEASR
jgi:mono/diheme cytochrome c family protein